VRLGYKVAERVRRPLGAKTTSEVVAFVGTRCGPCSDIHFISKSFKAKGRLAR
jgi:hypothetical protein